MKVRCVFALAIVFTRFVAYALTDTWDGGGANNLITLDDNWVDNSAPLSNIADTDLVFAGTTRLTPLLGEAFSARGITFNDTAGAFIIDGQSLDVGDRGIVNNDAEMMTFDNDVRFSSVPTSSINPAVGGLTFTDTISLPTTMLSVAGPGPSSFRDISGSGSLYKYGAGTMTWTPAAASTFDLSVGEGSVTMSADGTVNLFTDSASISVGPLGTLNIHESLTLDGAALMLAPDANMNFALGKVLTVQNSGLLNVQDSFTNNPAATIDVTGAGSRFFGRANGNFSIHGGTAIHVANGGAAVITASTVIVGASGSNGTVTVDGAGSSFAGNFLAVGRGGGAGSLTFSNGSIGEFSAVAVDFSSTAGTNGTLSILSGASVTGTTLLLASIPAANAGTVTITGSGSALTLADAATAEIGAESSSSGTLNVSAGGIFNTGTGSTTINSTGTINLDSGTLNLRGSLIVNGSLAIAGTGNVQGNGRIVKRSANTVSFPNPNNYTGGTAVTGGALIAAAANGALGSGNVSVDSTAAKLTIQSGVLSAIADNAILTLSGGGLPNIADNGFLELAAGVNEIVGGLVLGTAVQPSGTYGSAQSAATFQNDEFFSGSGILIVIPELTVTTVLLAGLSAVVGARRFRRSSR